MTTLKRYSLMTTGLTHDDYVLADDAARELERLDARVRELTADLEGANVCGKAVQQERDRLRGLTGAVTEIVGSFLSHRNLSRFLSDLNYQGVKCD